MKSKLAPHIFMLAFMTWISLAAAAQNMSDMKVVGIVPFTAISYSDSIAAKDIYSTVSRILVQTKRFTLLELDKWKQLQSEISRQKGVEFLESKIVAQSKSLGAQILVFGTVREAQMYKDGNDNMVRVSFEIKFLDVSTNKTIATQTFEGDSKKTTARVVNSAKTVTRLGKLLKIKDDNLTTASTVSEALDAQDPTTPEVKLLTAIENTSGKINKWVQSTFGIYLSLLKIVTEENGQVSEVLIEGGENIGMKKGDKLKTILTTEMITASGNKVKDEEEIAALQIVEIRSETSKCKVITGGKKLYAEKSNKGLEIVLE